MGETQSALGSRTVVYNHTQAEGKQSALGSRMIRHDHVLSEGDKWRNMVSTRLEDYET